MNEEREDIDNQDSAESINSDLAGGSIGSEEEFIAEPKAPVNRSTFVLFGIILLGMAGYYFMYVRTGPKSASGASVEVVTADQTIKTFLAAGDTNTKSMQDTIKNTEKIVQQFKTYPTVKQVPLSDLATNPFKFFTARTSANSDEAAARRFQLDRMSTLRLVEAMQLQSIVSGTHKACMINNTLYTEGQSFDGFTIEKIETDSVIIKSGTFRFRKPMQK